MKRMHSAERELKLAQKPNRQSNAKKFIPKVCVIFFMKFVCQHVTVFNHVFDA